MCLQSKVGRLGILCGEYSSQKNCAGILDLGTQVKTEDGSEYEFTSKLPLHSVATQDKITIEKKSIKIYCMNAMQHSQLLQVYKMYFLYKKKITNIQWTRTKVSSSPPLLLLLRKNSQKSSQPTLESSSIQTAEPIVKCHCTVLNGRAANLQTHSHIKYWKN